MTYVNRHPIDVWTITAYATHLRQISYERSGQYFIL